MPKLTWTAQGRDMARALIDPEVSVGRGDGNAIQILDPSISRNHAIFKFTPDGYVLNDLNSFNGTFVDGRRISAELLRGRHTLQFGHLTLQFEPDMAVAPEVPEAAVSMVISLPRGGQAAAGTDEQLRATYERLAMLYEAGKLIQQEVELENVLAAIAGMLRRVLTADNVTVLLRKWEGGELTPVKVGNDERQAAISSSIIRHVIDKREAVAIDDAAATSAFKAGASIVSLKIKSAMCAPLWIEDKIIGLVYMDSRSGERKFTSDDLQALLAMANQAAIAIERARLHEKIKEETRVRSSLERYMSPTIVEKVMSEKGDLQLGGEKRHVTVLFSDVRGFTAFSETHTAEEVVQMLNEYFTAMTEIIFKHQGTLDKYIGDAIMAVFGSPFSYGDDATRAVKAAVEMQGQLRHLNTFWREAARKRGFEIGIGIFAGDVVAGNIGSPKRMEFTVIGDVVNTASRLCGVAAAGQVIVGKPVWDLVKGQFTGESQGKKALKGKEAQIEVFGVTGEKVSGK